MDKKLIKFMNSVKMVEVTRSGEVESIHYGTAVLINSSGEILQEWPNHTHAVFKTKFWKFPDDFLVNLHCEDEEVVMYVYSKSRLGISDLGVNDDRVVSFTNFMLETEISTSKCTYAE